MDLKTNFGKQIHAQKLEALKKLRDDQAKAKRGTKDTTESGKK